jgi:hypothetical protein
MTSWSDSLLNSVNDWSQIVGLLALLLTLVSAWTIYSTGKEMARRSAEHGKSRTITSEQRDAFVRTLNGTPRGKITLQFFSGNTEAYEFAKKVRDLLLFAGYELPEEPKPDRMTGFITFGPPVIGVAVCSKDPNAPPPLAEPLRMAFRAIGINAERKPSFEKEDIVLVSVGLKE